MIAGGATPDHATLARFVVDHQAAIEAVFVQVLRLCVAAGLVDAGLVALDGTKMGADASMAANRTAEWIRALIATMVAEAAATDAAEDAGDTGLFASVVPDVTSPAGRQGRLEAALEQIEAEDAAEAAETASARARREAEAAAAAERGELRKGHKPVGPAEALERARLDRQVLTAWIAERHAARAAREAAAAAAGTAVRGRPPSAVRRSDQKALAPLAEREAAAAAALAESQATGGAGGERRVNLTDPDSRIMKTARSFLQGYNAQVVVTDAQVVIAAEVTADANDVSRYQPLIAAAAANLAVTGATPIGTVVADAGYWSESNATAAGPDRLIATTKDCKQRQTARRHGTTTGPPPPDATTLEAMEHRLRTVEGTAAYARRSPSVEAVFGQVKHNRGWRTLSRRGLAAARSEWALITAAHTRQAPRRRGRQPLTPRRPAHRRTTPGRQPTQPSSTPPPPADLLRQPPLGQVVLGRARSAAERCADEGEAVGIDPPPHPAASLLADDESGFGEDSGVVGDGRLALG